MKIIKIIKVIVIVILIVIFSIIVSFFIKIFFIGDIISDGLYVENITVSDNLVTIKGDSGGSADAYKGFDYYIDGNSLYIKLRYVLASRFSDGGMNFSVKIEDEDFSKIDKIYFTDGNDDNLIWIKGES
ncbi:hypothetical protein [Anaerovorax odorimutans]|uniref:hypothetical protein n=1 Tax=Anaerovorax odorimutans TaxID=109327 RepID=UPI000400E852|nr:hypothetical protein [Anaerovorax odorimutans]